MPLTGIACFGHAAGPEPSVACCDCLGWPLHALSCCRACSVWARGQVLSSLHASRGAAWLAGGLCVCVFCVFTFHWAPNLMHRTMHRARCMVSWGVVRCGVVRWACVPNCSEAVCTVQVWVCPRGAWLEACAEALLQARLVWVARTFGRWWAPSLELVGC